MSETGYRYRYRCDVIIRGRPLDLGLCYSNVTGQLPQVCRRLFITRMRLALRWQASNVASEASVLKLNRLAKLWVKVHHSTESRKTSSTHAQRAMATVGKPSHTTLSQCHNAGSKSGCGRENLEAGASMLLVIGQMGLGGSGEEGEGTRGVSALSGRTAGIEPTKRCFTQ